MGKFHGRIHERVAWLENCMFGEHPTERFTTRDKEYGEEDLAQCRYLLKLFDQILSLDFQEDGGTRRLASEFSPIGPDGKPSGTEHVFPAGTSEADILKWFEHRFCVSLKYDFGYSAATDATDASQARVSAKPTRSGEVEVTVETPLVVRVPITEKDVTYWMDNCRDPEVLQRLARYAAYCRNGLLSEMEPDPDDFRSRA